MDKANGYHEAEAQSAAWKVSLRAAPGEEELEMTSRKYDQVLSR